MDKDFGLIIKENVVVENIKVNGFSFLPAAKLLPCTTAAVFTHGYTSSKSSILSWGQRLAREGVASFIFDLPGHYLGSFDDVPTFKQFELTSPQLFKFGAEILQKKQNETFETIILGGHSLGALFSLVASENSYFSKVNLLNICVGLGLSPELENHLFETEFYAQTLHLRKALVSPSISPEIIFPWIKEKKKILNINQKKIHLITGLDDAVVPKGATENFAQLLIEKNNHVTFEVPNSLPHHMPDRAAPFIASYLKNNNYFTKR